MAAIKALPSFPFPLPHRETCVLKMIFKPRREVSGAQSTIFFQKKTCKSLQSGSGKCNRENIILNIKSTKMHETHPTGFKRTTIPCTIED